MKIIVNADDFGATIDINKSIDYYCSKGFLTSATLLAVGNYVEDAILITKKYNHVSFGVHLAIQDNFKSLSNRNKTLNDLNINYKSLNLFKIKPIVNEFNSQINKLKELGLRISHIDSHHHMHRYPLVLLAMIIVAKKHNIKKIRSQFLVFDPSFISKVYRFLHSSILKILKFKIVYGYTDFQSFYKNNFGSKLKNKTIEIMCHPGHPNFNDEDYLNKFYFSKIKSNLISYNDQIT